MGNTKIHILQLCISISLIIAATVVTCMVVTNALAKDFTNLSKRKLRQGSKTNADEQETTNLTDGKETKV